MNIQGILTLLIGAVLSAFPQDALKKLLDKFLDLIEDMVTNSSNQIDDIVILPVCKKIREMLSIPEFEEEKIFPVQKSDKPFLGTVKEQEQVKEKDYNTPVKYQGVYPPPFVNIKSELFYLNENKKRTFSDFIFIGYFNNTCFYLGKKDSEQYLNKDGKLKIK